jgi:hypothetical protein|tara:strand:+ start:320 stop:517 length:198 start_codon:yes stop_codon:yes gene_type:complete
VKTNFRKIEFTPNTEEILEKPSPEQKEKTITKEEFEDYVLSTGAKGSFMVYRSNDEDEELGIDNL